MARERPQKKSFQQSLDDIKERMKEKRNRRLASALAGSRRSRAMKARSSGAVKPLLLKSVQVNNRELAAALQVEREKVRQAQAVVLQLKKERQALVFHLLMLKRTLRERAQVSPPVETSPVQPCSPRAGPVMEMEDEDPAAPAPPAGPVPERSVSLPPSVGTRRGRRSGAVRRRSSRFHSMEECDTSRQEVREDHQQEAVHKEPVEPHPSAEFDLEESDLPAERHSTPEPPRRRGRRKNTQATRPRAERAPPKRPWDKPRPRSKSRERAQSRSTSASTAPQAQHLNTSLGGNDTFDFDCEEAVHLTPFRAGSRAPGPHQQTQDEVETRDEMEKQDELETREEPKKRARRTMSPRAWRAQHTHTDTQGVSGAEDCGSAVDERDVGAPVISSSPLREEEHSAPPAALVESPMCADVEPEPVTILSPLFEFPKSLSDSSNQENQVPSVMKRRRKGGLVVRSFLGLSDVTNLSPAANQKPSLSQATPPSSAHRRRRCTSTVDYKEPSISSKLRRGDKHTDTRFLRSPIFKQKVSSRRSSSSSSLKKVDIYNESFVGCR